VNDFLVIIVFSNPWRQWWSAYYSPFLASHHKPDLSPIIGACGQHKSCLQHRRGLHRFPPGEHYGDYRDGECEGREKI